MKRLFSSANIFRHAESTFSQLHCVKWYRTVLGAMQENTMILLS